MKLANASKENIKAKRMVEAARAAASSFKNPLFGEMYAYAIEQYAERGNDSFLRFMQELEQPPVSIEEFIDSENFLGATDIGLWPAVREAVIEINKYWWKGGSSAMHEAVLCGATSTGKSEISKITSAYHLHILGCLKSPQALYGLPAATSIVMVIQAAKPHVTKKIIYMPLRNYVETMPWFQKYMRPNKLIESEMYFEDKNIRVVPGGSDADTILGEAIIAGIIDEINFMNVVQKSKRAGIDTGRPGIYDQAQSIYDALTRRKKSRFITKGPNIGVICVSSSTRYRGDFTDKRKTQIENLGEKNVYLYDKAQFEVWPAARYSGEKFKLHVQNEAAVDIRVLEPEQPIPETGTIIEVPIEYKDDFLKDPAGALRDIVGKSVQSINPFFRQRHKIHEAVERGEAKGLESFLYKDNVHLGTEGLPRIKVGHYCQNPGRPRYVHIDLSLTSDRVGIAMVRYDGMLDLVRSTGIVERLPKATIEMAVTVEPDHGHEIDIAEIRTWVRHLKTQYGYPINVVTYDGWNSAESIQQWRKQGVKTGMISVDRTSVPYKNLRDAFNDGRIDMYPQGVLIDELFNLEYNDKQDKIDHPIGGGKDCADAVCGAYYTMLRRASTWSESHGEEIEDINLMGRSDVGDRYDDERAI